MGFTRTTILSICLAGSLCLFASAQQYTAEKALEFLSSPTAEKRVEGAEQLGDSDSPEVLKGIPILLRMYNSDPDEDVRSASLSALTSLAQKVEKPEQILKPLIASLDTPGDLGKKVDVCAALQELVAHPLVQDSNPRRLEIYREGLQSDDFGVQFSSAYELQNFASPEATELLLQAKRYGSLGERYQPKELAEAFLKVLNSGSGEAQTAMLESANETLGFHGSVLVPKVKVLAEDNQNFDLKLAARLFLYETEPELESASALAQLLTKDLGSTDSSSVQRALDKVNVAHLSTVVEAVNRVLPGLNDNELALDLAEFLVEKKQSSASSVDFASSEVIETLKKLMKDPKSEISLRAAKSYALLTGDAAPGMELVMKVSKDPEGLKSLTDVFSLLDDDQLTQFVRTEVSDAALEGNEKAVQLILDNVYFIGKREFPIYQNRVKTLDESTRYRAVSFAKDLPTNTPGLIEFLSQAAELGDSSGQNAAVAIFNQTGDAMPFQRAYRRAFSQGREDLISEGATDVYLNIGLYPSVAKEMQEGFRNRALSLSTREECFEAALKGTSAGQMREGIRSLLLEGAYGVLADSTKESSFVFADLTQSEVDAVIADFEGLVSETSSWEDTSKQLEFLAVCFRATGVKAKKAIESLDVLSRTHPEESVRTEAAITKLLLQQY